TLQASFFNFGSISSLPCPPRTSRQRFVIRAKVRLFVVDLFGVLWFFISVEPSEKSVEIMRKFSEQYARRSGTYFCMDKGVTSVVIKGLAEHKDTLGAPLCPCRHYDDKAAEAGQGFWNCPCVPMRESVMIEIDSKSLSADNHNIEVIQFILLFGRKECHCMLFLTPDNDFAGQDQVRIGFPKSFFFCLIFGHEYKDITFQEFSNT
ncbi:hypothetical protein Goshw_010882, partial [Gossypium schwendimanii]|nr:hypothetical protein [Gossypium schwendimanii]